MSSSKTLVAKLPPSWPVTASGEAESGKTRGRGHEDLAYRIELWDHSKASVEQVLAVTASAGIGFAAYYKAVQESSDLKVSNSASCLLFAAAKTKAAETPVRPLGENPCDALNEAHVFDFGELPLFFDFFFAFAITLLLSFDELDLAGTKAPSPDHRKTMVHYK